MKLAKMINAINKLFDKLNTKGLRSSASIQQ